MAHRADVCRRDLVDAVEIAEELPPVAVARLYAGEVLGQAGVAVERPEQGRLRPRLDRLQLVCRDVLILQTVDLRVQRAGDVRGGVSRCRDGEEGEETRILMAGKPVEAGGIDGELPVRQD